MDEKLVTVKFDGAGHQVDIGTFAKVLLSYRAIIQDAAEEVGIIEPVNVYVKATEPGSLDVLISIIAQSAANTLDFLSQHKDGIEATVILTGAFFALKKKLSDKKSIEDVEDDGGPSVTIVADGKNITVARNVYNLLIKHPKASDHASEIFDALECSPDITGFEMRSKGVDTFRADRDEFSAIASAPRIDSLSSRNISNDAWLTVIKPCLIASDSRKWEFVYNGSKITACISDQKFLRDLERYSFHLGTKMHVRLDIYQEYDNECREYLNRRYSVGEVYCVDSPPETPSMF